MDTLLLYKTFVLPLVWRLVFQNIFRREAMSSKRQRTTYTSYKGNKASSDAFKRKYAAKRPSKPVGAGFTRRVGYYGRYGAVAARMGLVPEKKFFDTALAFSIDTTGEVPATGQLVLIPQGDTESTRDGRKAVIKSIQLEMNLQLGPSAAAQASGLTSIYLVLDTQCNGAAAAATDVFTGTNFTTALLNLNNSGRFRILKQWTHAWNPGAGVTTAWSNVTKKISYFKRCNIPIDWSSTTGAIGEIRSNNIFLMAGADAGIDDVVAVGGNCRVRFMG